MSDIENVSEQAVTFEFDAAPFNDDQLAIIASAVKSEQAARKVAASAKPLPNAGDVIRVKLRDGEVVKATVLGSKQGGGKGSPSMIKVTYGEGFDSTTITVFPSAVVYEDEQAPPAE